MEHHSSVNYNGLVVHVSRVAVIKTMEITHNQLPSGLVVHVGRTMVICSRRGALGGG